MKQRSRAFTLLELITGLVIIAIISTAVCTLTLGSMNTDRYLRSTTTAQSEVELAMRRIINNVHEAQTGSVTVGVHTLNTLTQADAPHGYSSGATVAYCLQADPANAGQQVLMENDQRYGNNVLVHNVTTFNVTQVSGISGLYQIDLVAGSAAVSERHFKVFTRN
ncbi:MAG TPA: type II secretion system protein [Phycisphaerae bacterium]|nr:type II secretion system protein [Phycisphaerae bacterium]